MIPTGICVDLETTIAGKIHDDIRPPGEKRYETRIIEIGAVEWKNPTNTFGCIINPIPSSTTLQTPEDLFEWLTDHHQQPFPTLNFWSSVLVKRKSVTRTMFRHEESPLVWLNRTVHNRARDFVHWHNHPMDGPAFITEEEGLRQLLSFGNGQDWLAHNGKSFDYKVLHGCALRTGLPIPASINKHDTLHLFRKHLPGHKSYSQPKLYSALFGESYNAHVAIDDAKALTRLCQHASGVQQPVPGHVSGQMSRLCQHASGVQQPGTGHVSGQMSTLKKMNLQFKVDSTTLTPRSMPRWRHDASSVQQPGTGQMSTPKKMNLQFKVDSNTQRSKPNLMSKSPARTSQLIKIKGIGAKTVVALALVKVTTVPELRSKLQQYGSEWLRDNVPFGVQWRRVSKEII